jgi:hypothetical protein
MSLVAQTLQPSLTWQFESSNVSNSGLSPNLSTTGTYAASSIDGTTTTVGDKRVHTFTAIGTTNITFVVPVTAEVLVVAGGGGGGGNNASASPGGGGGAGEVFYSASYYISPGTYTVIVGDGGAGGIGGGAITAVAAGNGSSSTFGSITVNGGGKGGANSLGVVGGDGGSGGGGARGTASTGGLSVLTGGGQGNNGGASTGFAGAGGGGAGGVGADQTVSSSSATGGAGGVGVPYSISGSSVTYGIGGDGGDRSNNNAGAAGTANRGNGGGGAGANATSTAANGGKGGSGIVIISYNAAIYPAPTYVTGKYGQAINFNNTLSPVGQDPNCYVVYDVSSYGLSSNSGAMSLWLNSGLSYPITSGRNPYYINLQGTTYYSLQTENSANGRSSISFHTGSTPSIIIHNPGQTGVWNHHCIVFSNIGTTGASNTASYFYFNGSLVGSGNTLSQRFNTLYLGCQSYNGNGGLCSIDDVRVYNTDLSSDQVRSIYAAQGMPNRCEFTNSLGATVGQLYKTAP